MTRRAAIIPLATLALSIVVAVSWSGTAYAGKQEVTYTISDARAYGYKASIAQPVIQAAPKCDPKADKYKCDDYNHKRNCPPKVAFGPKKTPPDPRPPDNVDGVTGGAGDGAGNDPSGTGVPQSSAVRLNRLFSDGATGHVGEVLNSTGVASLQYVELGTPPWNNNGHTETDAFTNASNYEERCYPDTKSAKGGEDYAHFFSHSYKAPETIHYSECYETQCQFSAGPLEPTAEHGVTEVHLVQEGDIVHGVLSAQLENLKFPGGFPLTIDELQSYVTFESDGTPGGLKWNVISSAQGAHLAGQPISLPQGQSLEFGNGDQAFAFGMAGPYVKADKDGSALDVVAPGFFVATSQQTAFFAGVEITATFGRALPVTFPTLPPTSNGGPPAQGPTSSGGGPISTGTGSTQPGFPSGGGPGGGSFTGGNSPIPAAQVALFSKRDPFWAPLTILLIGLLGFLMIFLRWAQQFDWGRRMYEMQPMRSFDWLYRAFLKT